MRIVRLNDGTCDFFTNPDHVVSVDRGPDTTIDGNPSPTCVVTFTGNSKRTLNMDHAIVATSLWGRSDQSADAPPADPPVAPPADPGSGT